MKVHGCDKHDVRKLIEFAAEGEQSLSPVQFQRWRDVIMCAVGLMRDHYEAYPSGDSLRVYYRECWNMFDAADGNEQKVIKAIEFLRSSIELE